MRYYSAAIRQRVKQGPATVGTRLARAAMLRKLSVQEIAYLVGASRATVYNWYAGGTVANAYQERVTQLSKILTTAASTDAAWSTAC